VVVGSFDIDRIVGYYCLNCLMKSNIFLIHVLQSRI
jgi:hypothetical protein